MYYLIFNETNAMSLHHLIANYNEYVQDQQCANCHKEILYFSNFDLCFLKCLFAPKRSKKMNIASLAVESTFVGIESTFVGHRKYLRFWGYL